MSTETRKTVTEINETLKRIVREAGDAAKKADTFDPSLGAKIRKVGESGSQVVKHIEEKTDPQRH